MRRLTMKKQKSNFWTGFAVLISVLLLIGCIAPVSATTGVQTPPVPLLPEQFFGTATLDGAAVSVGSVITAKIDGQNVGNVTVTTAGTYGDTGTFGERLLVTYSAERATITFWLGDLLALQTAVYEPGGAVDLPLTFKSNGPKLDVVSLSVPTELSLNSDDSLSSQVTVSVENLGSSEFNTSYAITGKLFGIDFTLLVNDTISVGGTIDSTIAVSIGPSVTSGTTRTGDRAYSISICKSPVLGSQVLSQVSSEAWIGTKSNTTNIIAAPTLNVIYPTYDDVSALAKKSGDLKITGIPDGQSVTDFTIPLRFDPSIAVYVAGSLPSGITVTASTGLLTIKGTNLGSSGSEIVIPLTFKSVSFSGKNCTLSNEGGAMTLENAGVKYKYAVTPGKFTQRAFTPKVNPSLWVPASAMGNSSFSVSITVSNPSDIPVANVDLNLIDSSGTSLWNASNVNFGSHQTQSYTVPVTLSDSSTLNLTALPNGGNSTYVNRWVAIVKYNLNITSANKDQWKAWYGYDYGGAETSDGYNKTVLYDSYPWLGTYFTTNAAGYVNVTIDFKGNESEIFRGTSSYQKYNYSYYSYASDWNGIYWYSYLPATKAGDYPYTITLERNGVSTSVDGVLTVRDVMVDIKVLESSSLGVEKTTADLPFALYSRSDSDRSTRSVEIALSSGSSGRTLQGLEYLIGYPHGCPEQATSPMLAALFVKEYYGEKGMLSDSLNDTIRTVAKSFINEYFISGTGRNPQQDNGGWGWGRSTPTFGYTTLPMYGIAALKADIDKDPEFWNAVSGELKFDKIDLNQSAEWVMRAQNSNGGWSSQSVYYDSDYYDNVMQTLFAVQALSSSYEYLDAGTKDMVNASLVNATRYLDSRNDVSDKGKAKMASSYLLIEKVLPGTVTNSTVTPLIDSIVKAPLSSWDVYDLGQAAFAIGLCDEIYSTTYVNNIKVAGIISGMTDDYGSGGRWYSTYTTSIAVRGLNALSSNDIPLKTEKSVTVTVKNGGNYVTTKTVIFNATHTSERLYLTNAELSTLYGTTEGDLTGTVLIDKPSDLPVIVAVTSKEQVPKSTAYTAKSGVYAAIPYAHIDPITNNFSLVVSPPTGIIEGEEKNVSFTAVNSVVNSSSPGSAEHQGVMILEIITSADKLAVFDYATYTNNSAVSGTPAAYYLDAGEKRYIEHMYNESTGSLYVYIGSDNGDAVSIPANAEQTYYVPMKFTTAGTAMIEARLSPMYDDEMMALGDANVTVLGYGNMNLSAVDEDNNPVSVSFAVEGQVTEDVPTYSARLLEKDYNVTITYGASSMHLVQTIKNGEITEYTARFITSAPISVMSDGDVQLLSPVIKETISNVSSDRWNAANPAKYVLNISVAGDDANSTVNVAMPTIYWQGTSGATNSSALGSLVFDTIVCSANSSGTWTGMPYSISADNKTMTVSGINPATYSELSITLNGRLAGDVNDDGYADIDDACDIAWYAIHHPGIVFNDTQKFYGDVNGDGYADIDDACDMAWKAIRLTDEYYNPLI